MKLYALGDLHLRFEVTRNALRELPSFPEDWLIVAGDVGETEEHLRFALAILTRRFAKVIWIPGNHDLWTVPAPAAERRLPAHARLPEGLRGEALYLRLVEICRSYGVLTPEDEYVWWEGEGPRCLLAPLFLLYDYTFRPDHIAPEQAVEWAAEENLLASDEVLLHPDPYPSRPAWCHARVAAAEPRLAAAAAEGPTILINHWPLRQDLAVLPRVPRFSIWCGTRLTEDWHLRYRALAVIYGHLHIRATHYRDGVRCEEVSLGYPQNYDPRRGIAPYLRLILPHPLAEEWL
jgi:predicted phosphodiesterase